MSYRLPKKRDCYECGARPDQLHEEGCFVERCGACGGQRVSCGCEPPATDNREPWAGIAPGVEDAAVLGWFAKLNPDGPGWVPCRPDDPDAHPDVSRLVNDCEWDPENHRFVRD